MKNNKGSIMWEEDKKLTEQFFNGYKKKTIKAYTSAFNSYRDFHQMNLSDLLDEALEEQEQRVPLHKLSLYDRLLDFRSRLLKQYKSNTVKGYSSKIANFYKFFRVEVPQLPRLKKNETIKSPYIKYDDLLTKEEIIRAIHLAKPDLAIKILAMTVSGMAIKELNNVTKQQFLEGTYYAHHQDNFDDACFILKDMDNVVCTLTHYRDKTEKPYYSFFNPECVQVIAKHYWAKPNKKEKLFKYNEPYTSTLLKKINDKYDYGCAGDYGRLRCHMLRKYNNTHFNEGENQLSREDVDKLAGRSKTDTHDTYFKVNPEERKLLYVKGMNKVSLENQYDYNIVDGEIKVWRKIPGEKIIENIDPTNKLSKLIEEIGITEFQRELNKISNTL